MRKMLRAKLYVSDKVLPEFAKERLAQIHVDVICTKIEASGLKEEKEEILEYLQRLN